ncbi:hypothetical protein SAMN05444678_10737 [Sphingomonas sp. YR710]|uniref:hypothetical protein n=1 Tax=Sphingomonas sp. YR710 TaxID=1882773 RepID=UPI0008916355|nr:hypothetical protein [Sphingomonas sp. YR710]SDC93529.1 hypothetical protein SAMN05444678_10737 [Sphingomonas sp. YR710]
MNTRTYSNVTPRHFATTVAPFLIVALAALAARTALAATYPTIALLLFLWIASDSMVLALVARAPGRRPGWHAVLGALAAASFAVWLGSPAALRQALVAMPAIAVGMVIMVLSHTAWAALRARRLFRSAGVPANERWIAAASEFLPPALVRFAAAELSVVHMALFRWGGPADVPADARAFAYHRHLAPISAILLALSAIEVGVYHIFVGHWSRAAALVMFVLSDVGLIYLVGLIKSFRLRPVLITPDGVRIRAGFLIDQRIPLDRIAKVETSFAGADVRDPATLNAALLAWPNILLRLNAPQARRSPLRRRAPFCTVALRLDDPEPFVRLLRWRLGL